MPALRDCSNALNCMLVLALAAAFLTACSTTATADEKDKGSKKDQQAKKDKDEQAKDDGPKWRPLFNDKDLKGWKVSKFGGHGEPHVDDGKLYLPVGETLTGVTYTKPVPKLSYEVSLEAMRVDGSDFFVGLTFPYKDTHASLIIGGWGGGVCGISSLDGLDASENETTTYFGFENNKWRKVRLKVTDGKFEVWLDKEKIVDIEIGVRKVGIRPEVELSKPFGLATWQTTAALRDIKIRYLVPDPPMTKGLEKED